MGLSAVVQGSAPRQTLPPETKPEALRAKNAQLEGVVKLLSKQEQHRLARQEQETLVFHLKKKHTEDRQTVQNLEGYISRHEKEVRKNMEEHEVCKGPVPNLNLYNNSPPSNTFGH